MHNSQQCLMLCPSDCESVLVWLGLQRQLVLKGKESSVRAGEHSGSQRSVLTLK